MSAVVSLTRASALDERVLSADALTEAYARLGMEITTDGGPLEAARALETMLLTRGHVMVQCSECGGLSPASYPGCPYCGDVDDPCATPAAQDTLAKCIEELHTQKQHGEVYQVGRLLLRVRAEKLWRARLQPDGKRTWRSFKEFVAEELGLGVTWAYELMDAARVFGERDVCAIGPTKLVRILCAPREVRDELLEMARAGAPRREMERRIALARVQTTPGPMRAKTIQFTVPDGREWEIPLAVRLGSGPPVPAREVGSLEVVGAAKLAPNVRLALRIVRLADGTLHARARMVRTRPAPRNVKPRR